MLQNGSVCGIVKKQLKDEAIAAIERYMSFVYKPLCDPAEGVN